MSRNDFIIRIAAAVVGIVAIALAAATISSPIEPEDSGGTDSGEGSGGTPTAPSPDEPATGGEIPAFLEYLFYVLLVLVALTIAWYLIVHRRDLVKLIAIALVVGLVVLVLAYGLLQFAGEAELPAQPPEEEVPNGFEGDGEPGDGEQEPQPISPEPLFVVFALVTAIFIGALALSRRGDDGEILTPSVEDVEPESEHTAAVGAAAGRAAERIADADDVDNEVYRAWREMTELLEVDRPEVTTPGEFEAAAVEAGLAPEHVSELTRLFEDVRYGDEEITEEVASRAVSALRLIESEYANDDSRAGAHGGTDVGRRRRSGASGRGGVDE